MLGLLTSNQYKIRYCPLLTMWNDWSQKKRACWALRESKDSIFLYKTNFGGWKEWLMISCTPWSFTNERRSIIDFWTKQWELLPIISPSGENETLQPLGPYDEDCTYGSFKFPWTLNPGVVKKRKAYAHHNTRVALSTFEFMFPI